MIRITCPCHFGLESVLSFEMKRMGGLNVTATDGKVSCEGEASEVIPRANLCLSTAERVLICLGEFEATSFEELFQGIKKLPWEDFIGKKDAFPVKGSSLNSNLHSVPDCQAIIKKAVVERLKSVYQLNWFEETGPLHQIQFTILKDKVSVYLDTSGVGLHKRGYRKNSNDAPIKETLAAGIIDLAHVRRDSIVCDPFCGSGTFLIESGLKALGIPPGINRRFSAESWGLIPMEAWKQERQRAISLINKESGFKGFGSDIAEESVLLSNDNCKKAGISSRIEIVQRDISKYENRDGTITICNPPYGERMLEIKEAEELYRVMGQVFKGTREAPCYIISPHEDFEKFFGRKATKRRKLYNGMIKCQLFMYY